MTSKPTFTKCGASNGLLEKRRAGLYLNTLIVAVGYQYPARGGGRHSLEVGELSFVPPLRSCRESNPTFQASKCTILSAKALRIAGASKSRTNPEDEVVLDGVLGLAPRGPQGAAGPLGALLLLAGGLPSSLRPLGGAGGRGGVGRRVGCRGGGGGHLEMEVFSSCVNLINFPSRTLELLHLVSGEVCKKNGLQDPFQGESRGQ